MNQNTWIYTGVKNTNKNARVSKLKPTGLKTASSQKGESLHFFFFWFDWRLST